MTKYGYKGSETTLNGLTKFMYEFKLKSGVKMKGKTDSIYNQHLIDIVEFGGIHFPSFDLKGSLNKKADSISKLIANNSSAYKSFTNWYKSKYKTQCQNPNTAISLWPTNKPAPTA